MAAADAWVPVRRRVPNNHSCLFECFAVLCKGTGADPKPTSSGLRKVCADAAAADPDPDTKALMVGMPVDQYMVWIRNEMNWGGENEIVTLSEYFGVEVAVVSCESFTVLVYGQEAGRNRIHLLYTGQHYDPIVSVAAGADGQPVGCDSSENDVLSLPSAAVEQPEYRAALIEIAKTHVREFEKRMRERRVKRIKCLGCGAVLDDNQGFQEHCEAVEHDDDFAYDCEEVEVVESGDDGVPEGRLDLGSDNVMTFYNLRDVWFSPLYDSPIVVDDTFFPSAEHYFQWRRYSDRDPEFCTALLAVPRADELAMMVGAQEYAKQHPDWDTIKADVLREATLAKAQQHPDIAAALLATDDKTLVLIDSDPWGGVQAGDGIPTGRNGVGEAWMAVRATLRTADA